MEHRYLGLERFPDALSAMEIEQFFTLGEDEFAAVHRRRRVRNRLALGLQIGFEMTGGMLNSVEIIPPRVLDHLSRQLGRAPPRIASIRALYRRNNRAQQFSARPSRSAALRPRSACSLGSVRRSALSAAAYRQTMCVAAVAIAGAAGFRMLVMSRIRHAAIVP